MKSYHTAALIFLGLSCTLSACSKCYECQTVRLYNNELDTVYEDLCTASGEEIDQLESEGYTCNASGI